MTYVNIGINTKFIQTAIMRYYSNINQLREELNMVSEHMNTLNKEYQEYEMYEERRTPPPHIRELIRKINKCVEDKHRLSYHIRLLEGMPVENVSPEQIKYYITDIEEKRRLYFEEWQHNYDEHHNISKQMQEVDMKLGLCLNENEEYFSLYADYQKLSKEQQKYNKLYLSSAMKVRVYQDIRRLMYAQI